MPEWAMAEAERWDQVYAREGHLFTTAPNAFLVEVAESLPPGLALDIGMVQGRDAIWLPERGWDVTGLDISGEGLLQASANSGTIRGWKRAAVQLDRSF